MLVAKTSEKAATNSMQNPSLFFKSIPAAIRWLGGLALFVLVMKTIWLNGMLAPLLLMSQVSGVVDAVLESIIAAVIFYLIDVHYRYVRDRRLAGVNIGYSVHALIIQYSNILKILGVEENLTWKEGAPNFDLDRTLITEKCNALNVNEVRASHLMHQLTTPKSDFAVIIENRYKPHFVQINENQFLKPHMEPKLIKLMLQLSFNVNMLVANLDGQFPNGLVFSVSSIEISSRELLNYVKDDIFYSLGLVNEISGDDLFPPVNQLTTFGNS